MDSKTFNKQVIPLSDKAFRFAISILKDVQKAEDAVQELNIKLWEKRNMLDRVENIQAFVMRSIRNLCLDIIRQQGNDFDGLTADLKYDEPDPYKQAEEKDLVRYIQEMINKLPEVQRNVMRLRDVEGMEISEIAYVMQLTENAVSVNLSRARMKIREQLKKDLSYEA